MPNLTTGGMGIQRNRAKGSARPDQLWDALNCIVLDDGTIAPRAGSRIHANLPDGTVGLMTYREKLYVFADHYIDLSGFVDYRLSILTYPGSEGATLAQIHFAEPFLGYPYVVAEWSDGAIFHYWLEGEGEAGTGWAPNTIYGLGQVISPSVPNGYAYRAGRLGPPGAAWQPSTEYAVGDVVEPTTPDGYEYVLLEAYGEPPRSAATEPAWPTVDGALVTEEADLAPPAGGGNGSSSPTLPPDVEDRYGRGKFADTDGSLT